MADSKDAGYVRTVDLEAFKAVGNGKYRQLLNGHDFGGRSVVYRTKAPAGAGVNSPAHAHKGEQLFFMFSGKMTFDIEGKVFDAGPGSLVVIPPGQVHRNWNGGNEEAVFLNITAVVP